jgi:hypothetical protein
MRAMSSLAQSDQPVMLSYRCPERRADHVRRLLEALGPAGVFFQEQPATWWGRIFGNGATFSIRCPAFFVEQLHEQLANRTKP